MKKKQINKFLRSAGVVALSASMIAGTVAYTGVEDITLVSAAETTATVDYGLADSVQDGTILHCFDWKYTDITAELPNIAAAGFTSVQTSPAQRDDSFGVWYMLYQPQSFSVSTNALGTKEELKTLCDEAEKYGINVVVDVVANHMRGDGTNVDSSMSRTYHSDYYHQNDLGAGTAIDWSNRYQVTYGRIGMEDLNSEHSDVQAAVSAYVQELKGIGVDGIRWDAAKHIGLPSEGTSFWANVIDSEMYNYGEILVGPDDRSSGNEGLMNEYTRYMSVTDSSYSSTVLSSINSGYVPSSYGNWTARGLDDDDIVYWGESHDTYANDGGESKNVSQNVIDRAYALVAAKKGSTALYFSRPYATAKTSIMAGAKGSTHFTSDEVAWVNKFHNAMGDEAEYYAPNSGNTAAAVCRESGAVVVKGSGSGYVTVPNGGGTTTPGTYTDQISGNTFTVTATTISGEVGSSGIAVLMEGEYKPEPEVVLPETLEANTIYFVKPSGWSSDVYVYAYDESGTEAVKYTGTWPGTKMTKADGGYYYYTLDSSVSSANIIFTDGTNQYPGAQQAGLTYTAGNAYVFQNSKWTETVVNPNPKPDPKPTPVNGFPETLEENTVYFVKPSGWGDTIYIYAYNESGASVVKYTGDWPGSKMTLSDNGYYYSYTLPEDASGNVIFTDGKNQYPGAQQAGLTFSSGNAYTYLDGVWTEVETDVKPDLSLTSDASESVAKDTLVTLEAAAKKNINASLYMFTYTRGNGKEVVLNTYSTANSVTITPNKTGEYTFTVYAIDSDGNQVATATTSFTVE